MNSNGFKKAAKAFFVGVMIFSVGLVLAEDFAAKSKVPECKGTDTSKWDKCHGKATNSFSGVTYQGMWSQGKKHGAGLLFFANGDKYDGNFKDGEWKNGNLTYSSGEEYQGDFKNGKRHGKGTFINAYGEKYVGSFKNDERDGLGTFEYQNGDKYEGGWVNGFRHGFGKMTFSNGDTYTGEFKDGKFHGQGIGTFINGGKYVGEHRENKFHGKGTLTYGDGGKYVGEFKDGRTNGVGHRIFKSGNQYYGQELDDKKNGVGTLIFSNGDKFTGEFKNDLINGQGIFFYADGSNLEGIWENNRLIRETKVNLPNFNNIVSVDRSAIDHERQQLAEERPRLKEENRQREQSKSSKKVYLQVDYTKPNVDGRITINVQVNADTASLKINGEEQGGRADGKYSIIKIARANQETVFTIVATDVNGNTDTKTITVNRPVVDSKPLMAALNPAQVRKQPQRDAVAIIIGIADYKNLPRADFANDDASVFYDYAIRALGIKAENIKLLVDANADDVAIYQAFKTWLPSRVRTTTDVYVYYSGHGLPAADGKGLYLMPQRAHRDLIEKTAISQQEINGFILAARPSSVTIFLDSCYSGLARSGETLLASARPVVLKSDKNLFPNNFTVITASQADQISSSSPDLKHGIFSYYLMKGMEGEADADRDGRITLGEMQGYLVDNVGRHAGVMNRKQEPQLIGDPDRVLVGR